jgi:large subunit ribosomal protein L21
MSYAILQHGGRQYRVTAGDRLLVDRLPAEVGSMVALEPVLLFAGDGGKVDVGNPAVDGVRVAAEVISHRRGKKLRIFKYKPKKRYRKTMGFRADLTELRVESVLAKGEAIPEVTPKTAPADPKTAEKPARRTPRAKSDTTTADAAEKPKSATKTPEPDAGTAEKSAARPAKAKKDEANDDGA